MNVCNENSSIMIFRELPQSRPGSDLKARAAADREWLDHCRSRELAERTAAKRATCRRAREIHQELAQAYARMVQAKGAR